MKEEKLLSIDLHSGRSDRSHRRFSRFAVVLRNCVYRGRTEFESVGITHLAEMVRVTGVVAVLVDNLSEFRSFLRYVPATVHLIEVCNQGDRYLSLSAMLEELGLKLAKPDPLMTARLLLKLVDAGFGSVMEWSYAKGTFEAHPLSAVRRVKRIPSLRVDRPSQLMAFLEEIGSVDMPTIVIGKGKEAEVYFGRAEESYVFKVFYKYSPSTRRFRPRGLSASDWRMPTFLAALEFSNLRSLLKLDVCVPAPIRKIGPLLVMEGVCNESLGFFPAPSLQTIDLVKHGLSPSEVFEDCLNELYHMFTEGYYVHGDFSPPNLLVGDEGIVVIDVLQSRRFSLDEATSTSISFKEAVDVLRQDLGTLCRFFRRRYRLLSDLDSLVSEFVAAFC